MTWDKATVVRGIIVVSLLALYSALLFTRGGESARRSIHLQEEERAGDHVKVSVRIKSVNTEAAEIAARLEFQPVGRFAKDEVTPALNLKLLLNSVKGAQEIDFPRGKRMNAVEAVFFLDGNQNEYPFDRHQTSVWLLFTTPARAETPITPPPSRSRKTAKQAPAPPESGFGSVVLQQSEPVPVSFDLSASVPGFRFAGSITHDKGREVAGILLGLTRSTAVKGLSITVMTMMLALALSVFLMTLRATRPERTLDLVPLSLAMSLLFGLPALRSIQRDVPPVGVFADYISFIWAELVVAFSAVAIVWTWILRSRLKP